MYMPGGKPAGREIFALKTWTADGLRLNRNGVVPTETAPLRAPLVDARNCTADGVDAVALPAFMTVKETTSGLLPLNVGVVRPLPTNCTKGAAISTVDLDADVLLFRFRSRAVPVLMVAAR